MNQFLEATFCNKVAWVIIDLSCDMKNFGVIIKDVSLENVTLGIHSDFSIW